MLEKMRNLVEKLNNGAVLSEASAMDLNWDEVYKEYVFQHFVLPLGRAVGPSYLVQDDAGDTGTSTFFSVRHKDGERLINGWVEVKGKPNGGWTLTVRFGDADDNEGKFEKSTKSDKISDLVAATASAIKTELKI